MKIELQIKVGHARRNVMLAGMWYTAAYTGDRAGQPPPAPRAKPKGCSQIHEEPLALLRLGTAWTYLDLLVSVRLGVAWGHACVVEEADDEGCEQVGGERSG